MTSTSQHLGRILGPLRRSLLRAVEARDTQLLDLPDTQIEVLRGLEQLGPTLPSKLAEELGLARSTVSNLVRTMTRSGLVESHRSDTDGRSTVLTTSARARELLHIYDRESEELLDSILAGLPAQDRRRLDAALPVLERLTKEIMSHREQSQTHFDSAVDRRRA